MTELYDPSLLARLIDEVTRLREGARAREQAFAQAIAEVPLESRPSARNLLHYTAVRDQDLRGLQEELTTLGLSSLGRLEPYVLPALDAVLAALRSLSGLEAKRGPAAEGPRDTTDRRGAGGATFAPGEDPGRADTFAAGLRRLAEHTEALLGPADAKSGARIMVTMPSEAADDPALILELLEAGMTVMRINCAHDDRERWARMVQHLEQARGALGKPCRILCDLAGPKLRTGPIEPGPEVVHWRPEHDAVGQVVRPARIWVATKFEARPEADGVLVVGRDLLDRLEPKDELRFEDTRGRERSIEVTERAGSEGAWASATRGAYVASKTRLELWREGARIAQGEVGPLPREARFLTLAPGDTLFVTLADVPGRPEIRGPAGEIVEPASVGCTLREVFRDVQVGHRILFDDGKIAGVVREKRASALRVEVTSVHTAKRAKLRADKGINLPDTTLHVPFLSAKDDADLEFVVQHADMVGLSFVRTPEDVEIIQANLRRRETRRPKGAAGPARPGLVLKIETESAFEHLPHILLVALRTAPIGVMVARGDLGVELGFERLAEVQEEILWLSEAAHVPVIWATEVLDKLVRTGAPSRAEVSDAVMGARAECVMLNKGPFICEGVRFLRDVLGRMREHQHKKRAMLRRLAVSDLEAWAPPA